MILLNKEIEGVIFDLDGVITQTAIIHSRAWKETFDRFRINYVQQSGSTFEPINIITDYPRYIDGIPRYDGVRNFLKSRDIALKEGEPSDAPGFETVQGLGNLKNKVFQELLSKQKVKVYQDALEKIRLWKAKGMRIALISSSKNTPQIVEATGIGPLFHTIIDGNEMEIRHLNGKPSPDIFLEAARELAIPVNRTAIFEDAGAGISAGIRGKFKLVIGVARSSTADLLKKAGAHRVIADFNEL